MALKQSKFNTLLVIFTLFGASISTGISLAADQPVSEITTKSPPAPVEDSATVWDKTKDGSAKAWGKTKEVSSDTWDATREGSAKAWGKTKEVSSNIWDATKAGSARAWGKTKSTVQGWQETKPESETDSNQEAPAPGQ